MKLREEFGELNNMTIPGYEDSTHPKICYHSNKVYEDGVILMTNPPRRRWICKNCLHLDSDIMGVKEEDNEFDELLKQKGK